MIAKRFQPQIVERFFEVLVYTLAGLGFAMLAAAAQISLPLLVLFLLAYLPAFHPKIASRMRLSHRTGNLLTWLYLPVFLLDTFVFSSSFVPATLHLIFFVQLVKIHQAKQDRDYFYLLLLSFLQVLAASSLTIDASFLALFVAYVFVGLCALITFEIKRAGAKDLPVAPPFDKEDRFSASPIGDPQANPVAEFASAADGARAIRCIGLVSFICLGVILLLGTALFFVIPRFGTGYFHRVAASSSLSGFSDHVRLGGIGAIQLDPSVVMRVRAKGNPELLRRVRWKGVTLDYFDGKSWSKRAERASRLHPPGRNFHLAEPNGTGILLGYQVWLEPSASPYLFVADQALRLQGNLYPLSRDPFDGSVTARTHSSRRLTYEGESLLRHEASGSWQEMSASDEQACLQLPSLNSQIFNLAVQIAAGAGDAEGQALRIENFLQRNYRYSLEQGEIENPQPLEAFLLRNRRGHCEYFASSMVTLLRILRVPARIVNGFQAGEYNSVGEHYVIRGRDAHSWVEAWVPGQGWKAFDPTPAAPEARAGNGLASALGNYLDAFELFWAEWVVGYDDVIQVSMFSDLQQRTSRLAASGEHGLYRIAVELRSWLRTSATIAGNLLSHSQQTLLTCLAALTAVAMLAWYVAPKALWRYRVTRALRRNRQAEIACRFYSDFLAVAGAHGKAKTPDLTPLEYAASFKSEELRRLAQEITGIYNLVRFGGKPVGEGQIQRAYALVKEARLRYKTIKGVG